ncbi:hypothetical protein AB0F07_16465 [Streptomyces fructofermentans]|uniref:hypothetical protein n=1 Tax=Streptomyces fructofermentans TaxID=152141 RepID=UPI0033C6F44D
MAAEKPSEDPVGAARPNTAPETSSSGSTHPVRREVRTRTPYDPAAPGRREAGRRVLPGEPPAPARHF